MRKQIVDLCNQVLNREQCSVFRNFFQAVFYLLLYKGEASHDFVEFRDL